jgi:hypothetical protein
MMFGYVGSNSASSWMTTAGRSLFASLGSAPRQSAMTICPAL